MYKEEKHTRRSKEETRDIRALLVKLGVGLVLSVGGFLYFRIKTRPTEPSNSQGSSHTVSADSDKKPDYGAKLSIGEDPQLGMDSEPTDKYDKPCILVSSGSSSRGSPSVIRSSEDNEALLLPEFDGLVSEFDAVTINSAISPKPNVEIFTTNKESRNVTRSRERDDYEKEIEILKKRIEFLQERGAKLEVQLLEYYGMEEQESVLRELQNRLKINNIESKLYSVKIESLRVDNEKLKEQVADHSKVVSELEAAKIKIEQLKRKIRLECEQRKEMISGLTQRVANMKCQEYEDSNRDLGVHLMQNRLEDLEHESEELKEYNERLQQENAELSHRLESTQILANSMLEDSEKEELYTELFHVKGKNKALTKEVDRLQSDRYADAEELVYLRWINACLRYELRNYQPLPGKTVARDLSKSLSPTSEHKAKELIVEYATTEDDYKEPNFVDLDNDQWLSSRPSYHTNEHGNSPRSISTNKRNSNKTKFFAKLRRVIQGKHGHHNHEKSQVSSIRRSLSEDDLEKNSLFESQSTMLASSSWDSRNSSFDRMDAESGNRMRKSRSLCDGGRFMLGRDKPGKDGEMGKKSELGKYAEVLRDNQWVQRMHKKSASFSAR